MVTRAPSSPFCKSMTSPACKSTLAGKFPMTDPVKPQRYRDLIDHLVEVCHDGQGQIGARRVRAGVWNRNATADVLPDQHEVNLLLARMPAADREIFAALLAKEVELGVF